MKAVVEKQPTVMSNSTIAELSKPLRQLTAEDAAKQSVRVFLCFYLFIYYLLSKQKPLQLPLRFQLRLHILLRLLLSSKGLLSGCLAIWQVELICPKDWVRLQHQNISHFCSILAPPQKGRHLSVPLLHLHVNMGRNIKGCWMLKLHTFASSRTD